MTITPVILCGGSGTRLWPLSRQHYPKQFIPLVNGCTLLQETCLRLAGADGIGKPVVVCNAAHRFMVAEQMAMIGIEPDAIILEPVGRNTAPATALAAIMAGRDGADPVLLVLPADHHIEREGPLHAAIARGAAVAAQDRLVTFGIVPGHPETGYGYIRRGRPLDEDGAGAAFAIDRFVEKPDRETAERYLADGGYFWNSGMFLFKASAFLAELQHRQPEMAAACRAAMDAGGPDLGFFRPDEALFANCPADSIDYAVMESTARGAVVALDAGWNDVGAWSALYDIKHKDADGNVVLGDVVTKDVADSYLHATSRLLAVVGLRRHVVVETADAVMVAPSDRVQDVKLLVDKLKREQRPEALQHKKTYAPWGSSETLEKGERFEIKRLTVKPGARLQRQRHFHRAEHWVVLKGTARVTLGEAQSILREDESSYIPLGEVHRLENPGKIDLELIEVRTGAYLGEDDIVRLDESRGN